MKSLKEYIGVPAPLVEAADPGLVGSLEAVLGNSYVMYFKAHSYHWNIEGMFFPMLHGFFGDVYGEVYGSIDTTAEHIRILNQYAPISLAKVISTASIKEDAAKPANAQDMLTNLLSANGEMIVSLNNAFSLAEKSNDQGLMNYLADRLDAHAKLNWMIKSTLKSFGA